MPAIITNNLRITAGDYFQNDVNDIPTYVYFGGVNPWVDESTPPDVVDSTQGRLQGLQNVLGLKRIYEADLQSVIRRIDWQATTVYDEYNDFANLIDDKNPETDDYYDFYVLTDEFNVYKCISNNNRTPSTIKPTGQLTTTFETPDGYIWKYMYTVKAEDAFRFMTPNYIPCYTPFINDQSAQWLVQQSAIFGTIDHIQLTNGGALYSSSNPPTVSITGDGTGCQAVAIINDVTQKIEKILVTDSGQNYKQAIVTIVGGDGLGAEAIPYVSPVGGHGFDARSELGATSKMIRVVIQDSEGDVLPTNIDFRTAGIVLEPRRNQNGIKLICSDVALFKIGEQIVGQTSGAQSTIQSINNIRNELWLVSTTGQYTVGETISSQPYNQTEIISTESVTQMPFVSNVISGQDYVPNTGRVLFMSNREKIARGTNQVEEFRFVVAF